MDICKKCKEPIDQNETISVKDKDLVHIKCRYIQETSWHLQAPAEFHAGFTFALNPETKIITIKKLNSEVINV